MRLLLIISIALSTLLYSKPLKIAVNNNIAYWVLKTKFIGTPVHWITYKQCIKHPKLFFSVYGLYNKSCKLIYKKQGYSSAKWKERCVDDSKRVFTVTGKVKYEVNKVTVTKYYNIKPKPFKEIVIAKYLKKCKGKKH